MKLLATIFILIFVVSTKCYAVNSEHVDPKSGVSIDSSLCTTGKCIMKCCPFGKLLKTIKINDENQRICVTVNTTKDFSGIAQNLFKDYPEVSKLKLEIKAGIFEANETFMNEAMSVGGMFNLYLTDYPNLNLENPNSYHRWTKITNDNFCWEYKLGKKKVSSRPTILVIFPPDPDEPSKTNNVLQTTGMLVTSFFLLLVLVVYSVLPELRNLCGQILMAYVISQMTAFLLLAVMRINSNTQFTCRQLSYAIYYCFMASFSWMHVMSYDIWWTFRGYAKARPIHRRGESFKFSMYCLYAFGVPLALTIAVIVLNEIDMSHMPWFITPKISYNGCFLESGEKLLYLYIPMLILIMCNWVFYLMTAFNVWRLSRGTAVLDTAAAGTPQAHRTHRSRFLVYLKLSVVMGLNWVLEMVSSIYPGYKIWFISDFYNILIGVTIFLIFVCKREILRKLVKRYLKFKSDRRDGQKNSMKSSSSNSESTSSQETQTLQVCVNPKGPGYPMKPF